MKYEPLASGSTPISRIPVGGSPSTAKSFAGAGLQESRPTGLPQIKV
jgi:hypothetical protein